MFDAIRAAIAVGRAVYGVLREYDRMGADRLSPAMGTRDRRRLENVALGCIDRQDKGIWGWLSVDDKIGPYLQSLLKSTNLEAVIHGNTVARESARRDIRRGASLPGDAICDWQGPAADRAKP